MALVANTPDEEEEAEEEEASLDDDLLAELDPATEEEIPDPLEVGFG